MCHPKLQMKKYSDLNNEFHAQHIYRTHLNVCSFCLIILELTFYFQLSMNIHNVPSFTFSFPFIFPYFPLVNTQSHVHVHTHTRKHLHTQIHTYKHIYIHIHRFTQRFPHKIAYNHIIFNFKEIPGFHKVYLGWSL